MMQAPWAYRILLHCYPAAFRNEYAEEMTSFFAEQLDDARRAGGIRNELMLWARAAWDVIAVAPREHFDVVSKDLRYTIRTLTASPAFALTAILTLALGIGASTAIFSLWHGVLASSLPVRDPEQFVMLTNPNSAGVAIGGQSGERSLMTYTEFVRLRQQANLFASMAASQSSLDRWQARIGGASPEEATGRLVSTDYFEVLGVVPVVGNTFKEAGSPNEPSAVISHDYWQRRFGGRRDIVGQTLGIRKGVFTIIGVAPRGFHGETSAQRPNFWIPLTQQPLVLPGRDWLHDPGIEKVMWLHVFGRLRPGVSMEQAEAQTNALFQAGLEEHYRTIKSETVRKAQLDQRLVLRPAANGASAIRGRLANPLYVLLSAVGVLLLMTCANLANLLLARGSAREREVAVRLSLGANRGRLVRQLLTESVVLAVMGGLLGLLVAYGMREALVRWLTDAVPSFSLAFQLEPRVLAFGLAATAAAAVLFGLLPAWVTTGAGPGAVLKGQGRNSTSTGSQLRWGRLLVALQIALSIPLLVGAGLLIRTLNNLQHADLGYSRESLLVVRIDAQSAGYEPERREPLFRELLEQVRRVPGVQSASYSENGLFTGTDSGDRVEVEGYSPKGDNDQGSSWDQVGPRYFTTLGVPILMGRDILESDHAGSLKVCVINEAFARKFFIGRNPLGMHITSVFADVRKTHQVVGVVRDFRTHGLREPVADRYFVPAGQPLGDMAGTVFEVRVSGSPARALASIRRAIRQADESIPILQAQTMDDRLNARLAQDRILARLTAAFGLASLALAALGLYGVLSYAVARRRNEIGVRIALGAEPRRVVGLILRDSSGVVVAGLVAGAGLAFAASRLLRSLLYGLEPNDPLTLLLALGTLSTAAAVAALLPALRASRQDPMLALREE